MHDIKPFSFSRFYFAFEAEVCSYWGLCGMNCVCWSVFPSVRNQQTWSQKVSGENWPEQRGQHRHVQETALPGGTTVTRLEQTCHRCLTWDPPRVRQVSVCQVFKEVTLELRVDESASTRLQDDACVMKERDYRQACSSRSSWGKNLDPSEVKISCGS